MPDQDQKRQYMTSKQHYQNNPDKYQAHKEKVLSHYHANKDAINAKRRLKRRKPRAENSTE